MCGALRYFQNDQYVLTPALHYDILFIYYLFLFFGRNMLSFDFFRIAETAVAAKYPQTTKTRRMIFNPSGMATFFKYNGKRHKNTGFNSSPRSELS